MNCVRSFPLLLALCAPLTACIDECTPVPVGEPLTLIKAEEVLQVVVSGAHLKLFAYRQTVADPFEIVVVRSGGGPAERCRSGDGFTRLVEASSSLPVVRQESITIEEVSPEWFIIELWDGSKQSGIEHRLRRPTSRGGNTLMQWCYKQYVVAFDPAVWDSVSSGCRRLGAPTPSPGG
jgi:hypothetical protein